MMYIQPIVAYLILAIAVGYILKKFFLPKALFASKKANTKGCGSDGCGCH